MRLFIFVQIVYDKIFCDEKLSVIDSVIYVSSYLNYLMFLDIIEVAQPMLIIRCKFQV